MITIKTTHRSIVFTITLFMLLLGSLACNAAGLQSDAPARTVEPSAEALQSFKGKWQSLSMATPDGPFNVTFTESELTSAVNAGISEYEAGSGENIPLQNVQIHLEDNHINVYGRARLEPISVNGQISIKPSIGENGWVHLDVTEVDFGVLEFDNLVLEQFVNSIEQSINEPIQASPFNISLSSVVISDGEVTISGTIAP